MIDKNKVLFADIETHSADDLWDMHPDEFVRLCQYAWGDGEVVLTTSRQEMIDQIEASELVVFHNGISFDLTAIYGKDSIRPLELSLENRVLDTMVHANLVFPAPMTFETRAGHRYFDARKPEKAMKWLSLDNLCFQLGLGGKIGDLKELAKKYGGFGEIPVDDEEFTTYAVQDIVALRELSGVLNALTPRSGVPWSYIWREMQIVSIDAQNSRNGVVVDTELAQARVNELAQERDEIMERLVADYDFPTEGKSPWASAAGKAAIIRILGDYGITEETHPEWPRTPKGALKLGGQDLIDLTEGTEAEEVGRALATLKGQRSLAQLALDSTHADGRAHPSITRYQLSGRTSWSRPGITVWTTRGPGAVEKAYFLPDEGHVLIEADLSNADARAVAAFSGDTEFAKRFEPGVDGHELSGRLVFGDEVYDSDPKKYRQTAKACSHSWSYGGGWRTITKAAGVPEETAKLFVDKMSDAYPRVMDWREELSDLGKSGRIKNWWGRVMPVDKDRSYTQSVALIGQSATRELICDTLLEIARDNPEYIRWLRFQVHDALVWSVPEDEAWWAVPYLVDAMDTTIDPEGGLTMNFPADHGPMAKNWLEAGH